MGAQRVDDAEQVKANIYNHLQGLAAMLLKIGTFTSSAGRLQLVNKGVRRMAGLYGTFTLRWIPRQCVDRYKIAGTRDHAEDSVSLRATYRSRSGGVAKKICDSGRLSYM